MTPATEPTHRSEQTPLEDRTSIKRMSYRNHLEVDAEEVTIEHVSGHRFGGTIADGRMLIDYVSVPPQDSLSFRDGLALIERTARYASDNGLKLYFNCCTSDIRPLLSQMRRFGHMVRSNPGWSLSGSDDPAVEVALAERRWPIT